MRKRPGYHSKSEADLLSYCLVATGSAASHFEDTHFGTSLDGEHYIQNAHTNDVSSFTFLELQQGSHHSTNSNPSLFLLLPKQTQRLKLARHRDKDTGIKLAWIIYLFIYEVFLRLLLVVTYQRNWAFALEMQLLLKGLCKFLHGVWSRLWAWAVCWRCSACLLVVAVFDILVFLKFLGALEMTWRWAFGRGMKSCCMEGGKPGLQKKRSLLSIEYQSRAHRTDSLLQNTLQAVLQNK